VAVLTYLYPPDFNNNISGKYECFNKMPVKKILIRGYFSNDPVPVEISFNANLPYGLLNLFSREWFQYNEYDATYEFWYNTISQIATDHNIEIPDSAWPLNNYLYYRAGVVSSFTNYTSGYVPIGNIEYIIPPDRFPYFCRFGFFGVNPETTGEFAFGICLADQSQSVSSFGSGLVYRATATSPVYTKYFSKWTLYIQ
jgi:hypothetical protein